MLKLKNKQKLNLSSLFAQPVEFSPVAVDHSDELLQAIENDSRRNDDNWILADPSPEELQDYLQAALDDPDD